MPKFSIITPAYNCESYIEQCVDSALAQQHDNFEVIVVDDGSSDRSAEILRQKYGERIVFIQQENAGPGAARNAGVAVAKGEYAVFLDSDDMLAPWALQTYEEILRDHSPAWIFANTSTFETEPHIKPGELSIDIYKNYVTCRNRRTVATIYGTCVAVGRLEMIRALSGFDTASRNAEDIDIFIRSSDEHSCAVINTPATVAYRKHPQSLTAVSDGLYRGILYLIGRAKNGIYDHCDRRLLLNYLCRISSGYAIQACRRGYTTISWRLYWETFRWQLARKRFRYILGMPALLLKQSLLGKSRK